MAATGGLLSPEQAGAIADAVAVNPDAEQTLLDEAERSSVGALRLACAAKKAERQDLAQIEKRIHARRCVRRWRDAEGAEVLQAIGTKRDMAVIDQALKRLSKASQPTSLALYTSSESVCAVSAMIGMWAVSGLDRIRRAASQPSSAGRPRSIRIRSGICRQGCFHAGQSIVCQQHPIALSLQESRHQFLIGFIVFNNQYRCHKLSNCQNGHPGNPPPGFRRFELPERYPPGNGR